MLTKQQKYSIVSALATTNTEVVKARVIDNQDAIDLINKVSKYFVKKDGFIPKKVLQIIN